MKQALIFCYLLLMLLTSCTKKPFYSSFATKKIIAIQPLNDFNAIEIDSLITEIGQVYKTRVIVLKTYYLPKSYINPITKMYAADSIIQLLTTFKNDSIGEIIGLINQPIFTIKDAKPEPFYDDKIFGLATEPGSACIISAYRLRTFDEELYQSRLKNVIVHETGHNLGLHHCSNHSCIMSETNGYFKQLDNNKTTYCAKCKKQLGL